MRLNRVTPKKYSATWGWILITRNATLCLTTSAYLSVITISLSIAIMILPFAMARSHCHIIYVASTSELVYLIVRLNRVTPKKVLSYLGLYSNYQECCSKHLSLGSCQSEVVSCSVKVALTDPIRCYITPNAFSAIT